MPSSVNDLENSDPKPVHDQEKLKPLRTRFMTLEKVLGAFVKPKLK